MRKLQVFIIQVVILSLLCFTQSGWAQTLKRGPYLQTATSTGIIVKWRVGHSDFALDSVRYGTSKDNLTQVVTDSNPVPIDFSCGLSCIDQQWEMTVELTSLSPGTRYYYSIGTFSGSLTEPEAQGAFKTSPASNTPIPTRVWVIGDSGVLTAESQQVRDAYKAYTGLRQTDVWLTLGDNAYNEGTDAEFQRGLFELYPEILRNTPIWPSFGNHDSISANSRDESGPYYDIFHLPRNGEAGGLASGTEAYYSYNYGNVHFIALDSVESDLSVGGSMLTWLENDLQTNDREWIIAYWHHAPYTKGSHDSDTEHLLRVMRENVLPILEQYGTDLVLAGHSHSYERSFLIDGHYGDSSEIVSNPSLILNGGNGQPLPEPGADGVYTKEFNLGQKIPHSGTVYAVAGSSGKLSAGSLDHPAMFISFMRLGSMVLDIYDNKLEASFLGATGQIEDHFTIEHTPDTFAPAVFSVEALNFSTVSILFSESLDPVTAKDVNNYSINNGIGILQASLSSDGKRVDLSTSTLSENVLYTLTVVNVKDFQMVNSISGSGVQAQFLGVNGSIVDFKNGEFPGTSYAGTRDSYIRETSPSLNYGSALELLADGSDGDPAGGGSGELRTVISWNISTIPAGTQIESVSLTINVFNTSPGEYQLFEVQTPWSESTVNWDTLVTSGAVGSTPLGSVIPGQLGDTVITLNQSGVDLVQNWVDGSIPNHGFILQSGGTGNGVDIRSSEADISLRPKLTIEFTSGGGSSSDTTPPTITAPADVIAEATGALTTVAIGTATATDDVGVVSLTNNAPAQFPVGTTVVTWTAKDAANNTATATQNVTVQNMTDGSTVAISSSSTETTSDGSSSDLFTQIFSSISDEEQTIDSDTPGDVLVDFGETGLWALKNDNTWYQVHPSSPESMIVADINGNGQDTVLADFGNTGLWAWMGNSNWVQLHLSSPESMTVADIDGNGQEDVLVDFGGTGLWIWMNNSSWDQLHADSPENMMVVDLNGNSQDDVLVDFGDNGLWAWIDNSSWVLLEDGNSQVMATGNIDGQ